MSNHNLKPFTTLELKEPTKSNNNKETTENLDSLPSLTTSNSQITRNPNRNKTYAVKSTTKLASKKQVHLSPRAKKDNKITNFNELSSYSTMLTKNTSNNPLDQLISSNSTIVRKASKQSNFKANNMLDMQGKLGSNTKSENVVNLTDSATAKSKTDNKLRLLKFKCTLNKLNKDAKTSKFEESNENLKLLSQLGIDPNYRKKVNRSKTKISANANRDKSSSIVKTPNFSSSNIKSDRLAPPEKSLTDIAINSIDPYTAAYKNPNDNFLNLIKNLCDLSEDFKTSYSGYINPDEDTEMSGGLENEKLKLDKHLKLQSFCYDIEMMILEASNLKKDLNEEIKSFKPINKQCIHHSSTRRNLENIMSYSKHRMDIYENYFSSCKEHFNEINEVTKSISEDCQRNIINIHNINNINNINNVTNNNNVTIEEINIFNNTTIINNNNSACKLEEKDNNNNSNTTDIFNTTINNKILNNTTIGEVNMGGISFNLNVTVNPIINESICYSREKEDKEGKEGKEKEKSGKKKKDKKKHHHKFFKEDFFISSARNTISAFKKAKTKDIKCKNDDEEEEEEENNYVCEYVSQDVSYMDNDDIDEMVSINKPQASLIHKVQKNNEKAKILRIFDYDRYNLTEADKSRVCFLSDGDISETDSEDYDNYLVDGNVNIVKLYKNKNRVWSMYFDNFQEEVEEEDVPMKSISNKELR